MNPFSTTAESEEFVVLQALDEADFVIEAVSENEKIKQSIFTQLSKVWHGLLPVAAHMKSLFS